MNWLPSFLNPWTAALTAAVAVPALLALYFLKLRRQEMEVSSTLLWKKAIQDLQVNAPFQRLRRNLLLLLQLLLLLLLLAALARPVLHGNHSAGRLNVILMDRSASMNTRDIEGLTRLDEARKLARQLVDAMEAGASAMVIAFDDTPQTLQAYTSDKLRLKRAIDSIEGTDRLTRLADALRVAESQSTFFYPEEKRPSQEPPRIHLFSDGRIGDAADLSLRRAQMLYSPIGSSAAPNLAVAALSARRSYERPTEVQVFARFANYGPAPVEDVGVLLSVDGQGQRVDQKMLLLPERWSAQQRQDWEKQSGRTARSAVEFKLELVAGAVLKVEHMSKGADALAADDAAQIVVPPPRSLSVLLVSSGNYYLQRALESMQLKNPQTLSPSAFEQQFADPARLAGRYDVIIFDRHQPKALPGAGNFVYFGCLPPHLNIKAATGPDGQRLLARDVGVLDYQREHPLVRHLNLQRLYIGQMLRLELPTPANATSATDTQVVVEGTAGPLVVLHREARAVHLVVSFDLLQSNWPLRQSFPAFMHNAMVYLALGADMELRQSFPPGATPVIPRSSLQQAGDPRELRLAGPVQHTVAVPAGGDVALPALSQVGLYQTQPPVPQFEKIAINLLDENESNILPMATPPGQAAQAASGGGASGKIRQELWWWVLACLAVPLCLMEWWIYARRVHL